MVGDEGMIQGKLIRTLLILDHKGEEFQYLLFCLLSHAFHVCLAMGMCIYVVFDSLPTHAYLGKSGDSSVVCVSHPPFRLISGIKYQVFNKTLALIVNRVY